MSRNYAPAFLTAIAKEVTTLCYAWEIVYTDGTILRCTDLDDDLTIGGEIFYSTNTPGLTSTVAVKSDLSVDNFEWDWLFAGVSREDLESGRIDEAEIFFYRVDYTAPTLDNKILRGVIGDIGYDDTKITVEFRGMLQYLQQAVGIVTSATCRNYIGSPGCGIDLETLKQSGASTAGQYATDWSEFTVGAQPTGWTKRWHTEVTYEVANAAPGDDDILGGKFLDAAMGSTGGHEKIFTCDTFDGEADLDQIGKFRGTNTFESGLYGLVVRASGSHDLENCYVATVIDSLGPNLIILRFLNGTPQTIASVHINHDNTSLYFIRLKAEGSTLKAWHWKADSGPTADPQLTKTDTNIPGGGWAGIYSTTGLSWGSPRDFDCDYYAATNAGDIIPPGYEGGNISFYDHAMDQPTGYLDGGVITWLTGANAGTVSEVKAWDGDIRKFTLYEPTYHPISFGDTYEVTPGCDYTKECCQTIYDNYENFDGEPDLPGRDVILARPDVKETM